MPSPTDYATLLAPTPDDKEYGPRETAAQKTADSTRAAALLAQLPGGTPAGFLTANNQLKIDYAAAQAQYLANSLNCGIKAHWSVLPQTGTQGGTLRVDFIQNDRSKADPSSVAAPT